MLHGLITILTGVAIALSVRGITALARRETTQANTVKSPRAFLIIGVIGLVFFMAFTLLAMLCFIGARADVVEIGDGGTTNNTYLPGYNYYNYSYTQQIYTAEEIGTAGTINSIAFKNTGAEKSRTYNIYFKLTEKASFSGGTDWVMTA